VWNFAEIYAALDNAHGAELVLDGARLTAGFGAWLSDAKTATHVAGVARATVDALGGALEHTLHSLDPYLMQLQLRQRAFNA
jgi:3-deoxy-D-manno-octulosonic-acid transferase